MPMLQGLWFWTVGVGVLGVVVVVVNVGSVILLLVECFV